MAELYIDTFFNLFLDICGLEIPLDIVKHTHIIFSQTHSFILAIASTYFFLLFTGDCFTAAFAVAFTELRSVSDSMMFASAAAALCIQAWLTLKYTVWKYHHVV